MYPPSPSRELPRRVLLQAAGVGFLGTTLVAGCDQLSTEPGGNEESADSEAADQKEAPELARLVEEGTLPPLAERLPEEPMVVETLDRPGTYGGTLRTAVGGVAQATQLYPVVGYDHLLRWTVDWTGATGDGELVPNVAAGYEVSDDAAEFTITLRAGMRWSDGELFTADDVVFAVEDVLLNKELNPAPPAMLAPSGEPAQIEKLDDVTIRLTFPEPAALFLQQLATPLGPGHTMTLYPRHYLEQFHTEYNPDIDSLVQEEGFEEWVELFGAKAPMWPGQNSDLPTLGPWRLVTPFGEAEEVVFERNPYYWKVDPEGRQLPYIDGVVYAVVGDLEVMLLRALNGDVDLMALATPTFNTLQNKPVLADGREDGNYRFIDAGPTFMNTMNIHLNQTHADDTKRAIFADKNFRVALSHAIDRAELIDTTMQRQGEPYQSAPLPDSPFYDEEFATQYLEYDVALANSLLDQNYPERDRGIRLGPDGEPIVIKVGFVSDQTDAWPRMLELVKEYWQEVGVDLQLEPMDRSLWSVRRDSNEYDAGVWFGGGGMDVLLNPVTYFPSRQDSLFAGRWASWYVSGGADGEEPSEPAKRQMQLYDQLRVTADPGEQTRLMTDLLSISKEQFYVIGLARETQEYFVASSSLHNIPDTILRGWTYPTTGPTRPEQYFFTED